jgi:hypothetical protein
VAGVFGPFAVGTVPSFSEGKSKKTLGGVNANRMKRAVHASLPRGLPSRKALSFASRPDVVSLLMGSASAASKTRRALRQVPYSGVLFAASCRSYRVHAHIWTRLSIDYRMLRLLITARTTRVLSQTDRNGPMQNFKLPDSSPERVTPDVLRCRQPASARDPRPMGSRPRDVANLALRSPWQCSRAAAQRSSTKDSFWPRAEI